MGKGRSLRARPELGPVGLGSAVARHLVARSFERWQGHSVWSPVQPPPPVRFHLTPAGCKPSPGSILTPARGKEVTPGDAASSHQLSEAARPGKEGEDEEGDLWGWEQRKAARGLT